MTKVTLAVWENSEVLLDASVAVALMIDWPDGTVRKAVKLALPVPSVVTFWKPIKVCPCP